MEKKEREICMYIDSRDEIQKKNTLKGMNSSNLWQNFVAKERECLHKNKNEIEHRDHDYTANVRWNRSSKLSYNSPANNHSHLIKRCVTTTNSTTQHTNSNGK